MRKSEMFNENERGAKFMTIRKTFSSLVVAAMMAALLTISAVEPGLANNGLLVKKNAKLVGTWLVDATFTDPPEIPTFKVLITFMPGRDDNEGTLVDTNEFQLTPGPVCTPDQGVWERTGNRSFTITQYNFCFDTENGSVPAGPTKIRGEITLGNSGDEFTGRQFIEGFDTGGNVVFTGSVSLQGSRVKAEAPPPGN